MKSLVIKLAFPDPRLNPNKSKGTHWGTISGLRKSANWDGFVLARSAAQAVGWKPTKEEIPVQITFEQPDRRRRDRDNLLGAMKYSLDGIAKALGVDDSQFEPVILRRRYGSKPGAVQIEIGGQG